MRDKSLLPNSNFVDHVLRAGNHIYECTLSFNALLKTIYRLRPERRLVMDILQGRRELDLKLWFIHEGPRA